VIKNVGRSLDYHSILECNPRLFITTHFDSEDVASVTMHN